MSTLPGENTSIDNLFGADPVESAPAQPAPPDVDGGYQPLQAEPQPQALTPPSAPAQEPPAQPQEPQQPSHYVPLSALKDERVKRQELERQIAELRRQPPQQQYPQYQQSQYQQPQAQPEQIDPEVDPGRAFAVLRDDMNRALLSQRLDFSEAKARETMGDDTVDAALDWASRTGMAKAFLDQQDAYKSMVTAYQADQVRLRIGTDPAAYEKQLEAAIEARVLARLKQGTPPPANLHPSLSSGTRANSSPEIVTDSRDFFKEMMTNQPRRRG